MTDNSISEGVSLVSQHFAKRSRDRARLNRARIVRQERAILAQFGVLYSAGREPESLDAWRARFRRDVQYRIQRHEPAGLDRSIIGERYERGADIIRQGRASKWWTLRDSTVRDCGKHRTMRAMVAKMRAQIAGQRKRYGDKYSNMLLKRAAQAFADSGSAAKELSKTLGALQYINDLKGIRHD